MTINKSGLPTVKSWLLRIYLRLVSKLTTTLVSKKRKTLKLSYTSKWRNIVRFWNKSAILKLHQTRTLKSLKKKHKSGTLLSIRWSNAARSSRGYLMNLRVMNVSTRWSSANPLLCSWTLQMLSAHSLETTSRVCTRKSWSVFWKPQNRLNLLRHRKLMDWETNTRSISRTRTNAQKPLSKNVISCKRFMIQF